MFFLLEAKSYQPLKKLFHHSGHREHTEETIEEGI